MATVVLILALAVLLAVAWAVGVPIVVTADLALEAGAVLDTPLVIAANGVTIDGRGATIHGPGAPDDRESFRGVGVLSEGRRGVTIRNLTVRGFARGLEARYGRDWLVEDCDFSDNYDDPSFGWGDGARRGGVVWTGISRSTVRRCRAERVWNGLDLRRCHENVVEHNVLAHCSNVCLKLWGSRGNRVADNDLSWGLRIDPGEVHARDSTGVLIEAGSDGNRFERNDVTHGGDGIFIRSLTGPVSTGNVFLENDCSYANNNGFESWSPGNVFRGNRARHCSYGFWLGGSSETVLEGNDASFNGRVDGFHNAPVPEFGHAGIVFVYGPGHHSVVDGNRCARNAGAGIAFCGGLASRGESWRMQDLAIRNNELFDNEVGLLAWYVDGLCLANNAFEGNARDEWIESVTGLRRGRAGGQGSPAPPDGPDEKGIA